MHLGLACAVSVHRNHGPAPAAGLSEATDVVARAAPGTALPNPHGGSRQTAPNPCASRQLGWKRGWEGLAFALQHSLHPAAELQFVGAVFGLLPWVHEWRKRV